MSLKLKKLFVDGRMYGRADGHLKPTLLGRLEGVDLKIELLRRNGPGSPGRKSETKGVGFVKHRF